MQYQPGRASSHARSILRALVGVFLAISGLIAAGCGNSTITYGTVVTTVSSDPGPFAAYIVDLYGFTLALNNGNANYGYNGALGAGKTIDFVQLAATTELLGSLAVVEGTYTSATVTFNYSGGTSANDLPAQLFLDINGTSTQAVLYDPTSTASPPASPGAVTYTIKFDPGKPLVVKHGTPVRLDFHFDTTTSSLIDTTVTPPTVVVRPFLTASTQPLDNKRLRARGELVVVDKGSGTITVNMQSFFDAPDYSTQPHGAVKLHTTDQTTYDVNGKTSQGAAGLNAVATLREKVTTVMAYGTLTDLSGLDPVFEATEVYAGSAIEDPASARATGTIVSSSDGTLHLHNAEIVFPRGATGTSADVVQFQNDVPLTVSATTGVSFDQQPQLLSDTQSLSIGQQVDVMAPGFTLPSSSASATLDASTGLVRVTPGPLQPAEQVLTLQWKLPGVTSPFSTLAPRELVPNMDSLGTVHFVNTGPSALDLTNPAVTPIIVPDDTVPGEFSMGNGTPGTTTGISAYQGFSQFVSHVVDVSTGVNTFVQLTAVGHYDEATHIFTAYRIHLVVLP